MSRAELHRNFRELLRKAAIEAAPGADRDDIHLARLYLRDALKLLDALDTKIPIDYDRTKKEEKGPPR